MNVVDHGTNFYAASALRDSHSARDLRLGHRGPRTSRWREAGWAGALSLPRQVWLATTTRTVSAGTGRQQLRVGGQHRRTAPGRRTVRDRRATPTGRVRFTSAKPSTSMSAATPRPNSVTVDRYARRQRRPTRSSRPPSPPQMRLTPGQIVRPENLRRRIHRRGVHQCRPCPDNARLPVSPPPWRVEAPEGCEAWTLATPR